MTSAQFAAGAETNRATYGSFLQLDVLLDLQPPTASDEASVALEKHFFVLIHQAFELWFKQIIRDIDGAIADLAHGRSGWHEALRKLDRAIAVQALLEQQMGLLSQLDRSAFLTFRDDLGSTSAAQSSQFREIQQRLGFLHDDDPGPLWHALCRCAEGVTTMRSQAAEVVDALSDAWLRLWTTHVSSVAFLIDDRPGTGGTSGVEYLQRNLATFRARAIDRAARDDRRATECR